AARQAVSAAAPRSRTCMGASCNGIRWGWPIVGSGVWTARRAEPCSAFFIQVPGGADRGSALHKGSGLVAELLVAGLAVAADRFDRRLQAWAGDRRAGQGLVEAGAQVGRVRGEALVLAQVAEGRLDVVGHHPQRLQVRQDVGGAAAVLLDVAGERADVR